VFCITHLSAQLFSLPQYTEISLSDARAVMQKAETWKQGHFQKE